MGLILEQPSPRSWMALVLIEKDLKAFDMAPTMKELADKLGLVATSAARRHVLLLEEMGLITFRRVGPRSQIGARSVRLTAEGEAALNKYRAMLEAGIVRGPRELALTKEQLELARAAEVPVDSFKRGKSKKKIVLMCRNGEERDLWAERILEVISDEG